MLRTDEDPELLVFDPVIRFFDWLTLFLVATIFVLAFSIDFASSKEEAVALIQLHRSFGVTVWVVTSGPGARPMARQWVENIRAVCQDQNVAFFFKQWGGTHKGRQGRLLDGRTWDEYPVTV